MINQPELDYRRTQAAILNSCFKSSYKSLFTGNFRINDDGSVCAEYSQVRPMSGGKHKRISKWYLLQIDLSHTPYNRMS